MKRSFDDTLMEMLVSRTLRIGVYTSSLFMLAGFIVLLFHPEFLLNPAGPPSFNQFLSLAESGSAFFSKALNPYFLFYLGILLLLLTPILRVIIAITSFVLQRDVRFTLISITVLSIILFSLLLSFTEI